MALSWNIKKCKWEGHSAYTDTLVWATMTVGMGDVTEKNVDEFIRRILIYQKVVGPLLTGPVNEDGTVYTPEDEDAPLPEGVKRGKIRMTADVIRQHIGLSTNVADISKAKFKGCVMAWLEREVKEEMKRDDD